MIHFKTDSYPMQEIRRTCDAEIGSVKRGWHGCHKRAYVTVESRVCPGMYLDYCQKHAPKPIERINHG